MSTCPFCEPAPAEVEASSEHAVAMRDGYPVTEGHLLVIPRRHVQSVFDLDEAELADLWRLVARVRDEARRRPGVTACTVGINDGAAAGQTVSHAHVHVIPRRHGDVPDPRGGVRWVIPRNAAYWHD
jgi:diadenosine tetraphosphate (Ap4A) HIT family hydrolase